MEEEHHDQLQHLNPSPQSQQQQQGLQVVLGAASSDAPSDSSSDLNFDHPIGTDELKQLDIGKLKQLGVGSDEHKQLDVRELRNLSLQGFMEDGNEAPSTEELKEKVKSQNDNDDEPRSEAAVKDEEVNVNGSDQGDDGFKAADDKNGIWNGKDGDGFNHSDEENGDANGYDKWKQDFDKENDSWSDNENGKEGYTNNDNGGWDAGTRTASRDGRSWTSPFTLRPDSEDCPFFMKTGTCKFGSHCKFNHPPGRKVQGSKEKVKQKEEHQERPAQTECKYYLTSEGCKYGSSCRYNHSREKTSVTPILEFNFLGLPIRLGEKECPYYMRTGSCKYGSNCRFNHPDPMAAGGNNPPRYANGVSGPKMLSWSSPMTLNGTTSYVPVVFPPIQGVPATNSEWNKYQAPMFRTSERNLPTAPAFAMNNPATETSFYTHQEQTTVEEFPERPGEPECSFFLRTGQCKFKSSCKFHHPKNRISSTSACVLSDKGLPLRPDQNICSHYKRYGICKFGPSCKYDHPVSYDTSASLGADQSLLSDYEWS